MVFRAPAYYKLKKTNIYETHQVSSKTYILKQHLRSKVKAILVANNVKRFLFKQFMTNSEMHYVTFTKQPLRKVYTKSCSICVTVCSPFPQNYNSLD